MQSWKLCGIWMRWASVGSIIRLLFITIMDVGVVLGVLESLWMELIGYILLNQFKFVNLEVFAFQIFLIKNCNIAKKKKKLSWAFFIAYFFLENQLNYIYGTVLSTCYIFISFFSFNFFDIISYSIVANYPLIQ